MSKTFEELLIWQKARELCQEINKLIEQNTEFKKDFRLKAQIKASSGSVMDNIAEGYERGGNKEFLQFLYIAKGSLGETRSQFYRCFDNGYFSEEVLNKNVQNAKYLSVMIFNLIKSTKESEFKGEKYK